MVLVQKWPFFHLLLRKYRPGKSRLRHSRTKTLLSRLQKKNPKSRKIDIFPKGLTTGFGPKMAIFPTYSFYAI